MRLMKGERRLTQYVQLFLENVLSQPLSCIVLQKGKMYMLEIDDN